jgi:protein-tyrosine phosphatase
MFETKAYSIQGPWQGTLAVTARPRGGEWLDDEIAAWKRAAVHTVVSLLTPEEHADLDLAQERSKVEAHGMEFISFPIPDRGVPESQRKLSQLLEKLDKELHRGRNVVVHCRQGVGRAGLVASCLLVAEGLSPDAAAQQVSDVRGVTVPETEEQRRWIEHYAIRFTGREVAAGSSSGF